MSQDNFDDDYIEGLQNMEKMPKAMIDCATGVTGERLDGANRARTRTSVVLQIFEDNHNVRSMTHRRI